MNCNMFKTRWLIEGSLTTESRLVIGNGEVTFRENLTRSEPGVQEKTLIEISSVAVDYSGRAIIPGSALRGVLRSWLNGNLVDETVSLEELFGDTDTSKKDAKGGRLQFWDAPATTCAEHRQPPPYWDPNRLTGVSASVTINRITRTAEDNKLRNAEFVPAGVSFAVRLSAVDVDVAGSDLEPLLAALAACHEGPNPWSLGAEAHDGCGRVRWSLARIRRLDEAHAIQWLKAGAPSVGLEACKPLEKVEVEALIERARRRLKTKPPSLPVRFDIALTMDSHFLVNDTSRTGKGKELPDHAPLLDLKGRALLPASSMRGALRAQAERILRTMAINLQGTSNGLRKVACGGGEESCKPIYSTERAKGLCLACRLFGAPGWKSPFYVSDFKALGELKEHYQEFVAIDRFTGGGADKLKFNARSVLKPTLKGFVAMDVRRLEEFFQDCDWALGLLALVLRDLAEGDISLGFGAAKGYGQVAKIKVSFAPGSPDSLSDSLQTRLTAEKLEELPLIEGDVSQIAVFRQEVDVLEKLLKHHLGLDKPDSPGEGK